jgi:hypothetical protein
MENGLRIGVREESMALPLEIRPYFSSVVDLTVEDHPAASILATIRLITDLDTESRKSPNTQRNAVLAIEMKASRVRAAVRQCPRHPVENLDSRIAHNPKDASHERL